MTSPIERNEDQGSSDRQAERPIFFSPPQELSTREEWEAYLTEITATGIGFDGNISNAAILMESFSTGKRYVHDAYGTHVAQFGLPLTTILVNAHVLQTGQSEIDAAAMRDARIILVNIKWLERFSNGDPHGRVELLGGDGTTLFRGRRVDLFSTTGVEEAHHDIYNQVRANREIPLDSLTTTTAVYQASDVEWHGLRWVNRFAREQRLPQETQAVFAAQLQAARAVRQQRRRP